MKNSVLLLVSIVMFSCETKSQNSNENDVKSALTSYVKAGDTNDVKMLRDFLHSNFRVSLYDGEKDSLSILDKSIYENFIETKKFGGYKRAIKFENIQFIGENMVTVKVTLTSPGKPTLKNFYSLVKTKGKWRVFQDFVTLIP